MNTQVLLAIFKRNIVSYFSNPTGYVFVCVFVTAASVATFWPADFFSSNLANLDQLTFYLPYILLGFIPAITMTIWAEERRQGTDELLLTIPATDLDVVIGKFLAAVATYSVALAFSMIVNLILLNRLGSPDLGLYFGAYVGYWFMGVCMLSVGMVASFLTSNLTVGFILGVLFNLPLVLPALAGSILPQRTAAMVRPWSVSEQFKIFERGVISMAGVSYFVLITIVMLYLSVVLIGRRHWLGGRDGSSLIGHFVTRTVALLVLAVAVMVFFTHHDRIRYDMTSEKLSSLSPKTIELIRSLPADKPIVVEAYISPDVPAEYAETRRNLISMLDEMSALAGGKIRVQKHFIEQFSEEAALAEQKHGIKPERVASRQRGVQTVEEIYLGLVFSSGLEKVSLPFLNKGLPVEYELIRSIATVAQQARKRIGVIRTGASLFEGFDMASMSRRDESELIKELKKQYEVVEVDASKPITENFDVLLAVQPSALDPASMKNFVAAVKDGLPTAIFEDPLPMQSWQVVGTDQPNRPQQQSMFMQQPARPKGEKELRELWDFLGVDFIGDQIIWEDYNPYPKFSGSQREFLFVRDGMGRFDQHSDITSGMHEVLMLYAGGWRKLTNSKLEFTPLVETSENSNTVNYAEAMQSLRGGGAMQTSWSPSEERYVLAAHVHGELETEVEKPGKTDAEDAKKNAETGEKESTDKATDGKKEKKTEKKEINVVLVSDIDWLLNEIFMLRQFGSDPEMTMGIDWEFQNVTFVLNILDVLADKNHPFVEIRKRRRVHRKLSKLEKQMEDADKKANEKRQEFVNEFNDAVADAEKNLMSRVRDLEKHKADMDPVRYDQSRDILLRDAQRRLAIRRAELSRERDEAVEEIERNRENEIRGVQDRFKVWAAVLPPILPIILGFFVFFHRRGMEREGVAKQRLR